MNKTKQVFDYINYSAKCSHDDTQLWIRYLNKMISKNNPDRKEFLEALAKHSKVISYDNDNNDPLYELDSIQHIVVGMLFKSTTFYNLVINLDQKVDLDLLKVKLDQLLNKEIDVEDSEDNIE